MTTVRAYSSTPHRRIRQAASVDWWPGSTRNASTTRYGKPFFEPAGAALIPLCIEAVPAGPMLGTWLPVHACVLLPETSCEHQNQLLDRMLLIGTDDQPQLGSSAIFFENKRLVATRTAVRSMAHGRCSAEWPASPTGSVGSDCKVQGGSPRDLTVEQGHISLIQALLSGVGSEV